MTETSLDEALQKILKQRACELAKTGPGESEAQDVPRLLSFSLGEERFGLNIEHIQEIQPLKRGMWSLVPCTPDFIVGAVNLRGRIYSMMNIAAYLGIAVDIDMEKAHVLLIVGETAPDRKLMEFCIVADGRPKLEKISLSDVQPPTGAVSAGAQGYIKGVTADMLMILDMQKLISDPGIIVREETA